MDVLQDSGIIRVTPHYVLGRTRAIAREEKYVVTITVYPTKDRILSVLQMLDFYRLIDTVYFLKFVEYIIRVKMFFEFR